MLRRYDQLTLSDIESFLREVEATVAAQRIRDLTMVPRSRTGTPSSTLESHWLTHLQRLSMRYHLVDTTRAVLEARRVRHLDVQRSCLSAEHGKYRITVDVEPPSGDLTPVRDHLAEQARKGRGALLAALGEGMAARSDFLLPSREGLRTRCTCPLKRKTCGHVLGVLSAFAARLDAEPELLLRLRGIEPLELCPGPLTADEEPLTGDLAAIFGIDLEPDPAAVRDVEPAASATPPAEQKEVRREHLRVLGLPSRMIDAWLREGVLGRTGRRDVYLRTPEANQRIALRLAR